MRRSGLGVPLARAAEPERAAHEDRPVRPRQVELVHRLYDERRRQPLALGLLATVRHHVRRDVAAVDVEPGPEVRDQQPPRSARDVERRLTVMLDVALEVRDLVRAEVVVELRPPGRDQAVMPRLGYRLQLVAHEAVRLRRPGRHLRRLG